MSERKPFIVTTGSNGRCVVFGYAEAEPESGKPCKLYDARMVIRFTKTGLFGMASKGPETGARISAPIAQTTMDEVKQTLAVSDEAAKAIEAWAPWSA